MKSMHVVSLVILLVLLPWPAWSQPPAIPVLTEVQRLKIEVLSQAIAIAQLRTEAAQKDYAAAQRDLADTRAKVDALTQTLHVDGYMLDLQTLTYSPAPPADGGQIRMGTIEQKEKAPNP